MGDAHGSWLVAALAPTAAAAAAAAAANGNIDNAPQNPKEDKKDGNNGATAEERCEAAQPSNYDGAALADVPPQNGLPKQCNKAEKKKNKAKKENKLKNKLDPLAQIDAAKADRPHEAANGEAGEDATEQFNKDAKVREEADQKCPSPGKCDKGQKNKRNDDKVIAR